MVSRATRVEFGLHRGGPGVLGGLTLARVGKFRDHVVERGGEPSDLVAAAEPGEHGGEVAGRNLLHRADQALDRPRHAARHGQRDRQQHQPHRNGAEDDGTAQRRAVGKLGIDHRGDFQNAAQVAELPILLRRRRGGVVAVDAGLQHHGVCHRHADHLLAVPRLGAGKGLLRIRAEEIPGLLFEGIEPTVLAAGKRVLAVETDRGVLLGEQSAQIVDHRHRERNCPGVALVIGRGLERALNDDLVDHVLRVVLANGFELGCDVAAGEHRLINGVVRNHARNQEPDGGDRGDHGERDRRDHPPCQAVS